MSFSEKILHWYAQNKRELPWRNSRDPYKIWLSEIILQQTRVAQGIPYYHKFLEHFPSVIHLAEAEEQQILKLWQGLGYYSRARNLHHTARTITFEYGGVFPETYEGLRKLKGVGDYTASAIASICFNLPEAVVDGNVHRVLARYFGCEFPLGNKQGAARFKALARKAMDVENIRDYNQGIMEFGSLQCTPGLPDCPACPLQSGCVALRQGRIGELPVKLRKIPVKKRFFNYLVLKDAGGNTLLRKRTGSGIWQQLYEFPLIESEKVLSKAQLRTQLSSELNGYPLRALSAMNEVQIVHKLSHQHLYTTFWLLETPAILADGIPIEELERYPVPVLIADGIRTLKNSYF